MKLFLSIVVLVLVLVGECVAPKSQREIIDFLTQYGNSLMTTTEKFLHEQRRLGKESLLKSIEAHIIEVEVLVVELQKRTIQEDNEKALHELHQIEVKLFGLENLITEETLHVTKLSTNQPTVNLTTVPATTPYPVSNIPTQFPLHQTVSPHDPDVALAKELIYKANSVLKTYFGVERSLIETEAMKLQHLLTQIINGQIHETLDLAIQNAQLAHLFTLIGR